MQKKILLLFLSLSFLAKAQNNKKITITGSVLEQGTDMPLEYASVVLIENQNPTKKVGVATDFDGNFSIDITPGTYTVQLDYISFKQKKIANKTFTQNTNLGKLFLSADLAQLSEVSVVAERSTVEIKLDKKVYNVGKDMVVKGGTAGDVLNNVPSVTVDTDGTVALRGNSSVRILIDGRPSGIVGINIENFLRTLPADAIEKVEVITSPSARYDAEGGGGIINIVLRKGKTNGLNGSLMVMAGDPETYGANANINFKNEKFNLFSNIGYNDRTTLGNFINNSRYLNDDNTTERFAQERRNNTRNNRGHNVNFGVEYFITENASIINGINFRKDDSFNNENVDFFYFDQNNISTFDRNRFNATTGDEISVEYNLNFTQKFKKDDHKLTIDIAVSDNNENDYSTITDQVINNPISLFIENTANLQKQQRNLIQSDYVLPIGENSRFEAGYRGSFLNSTTDFSVTPNTAYTNFLEYNEYINALYSQFGSKINKFSYFFGLRFEDNNIDVNSITTNNFNNKKYNNLFPSATLNYEFSEETSVSINYSKRVNRPRGRFLSPFSTYSSNINIFQGNPDLNPSFTDNIELSLLQRWNKLTLTSAIYTNQTENSFQFIRKESGDFVDGIPVIVSTPINLTNESRYGFEFNANYTPYKWWRINGSFNFFLTQNRGDYTYTNYLGENITQNFDVDASSYFTRISSKITLPKGIDFQTNYFYSGPQNNAQGKYYSMSSLDLAFSKDILKEKATVNLNVSDLFNTRKRRFDTFIPGSVDSYSAFQWRQRQINMSFTYRFNKKKEREGRSQGGGGGDEYM